MALLSLAVVMLQLAAASDTTRPAQVTLGLKSATPINTVSDGFISFALDSSIVLGGADVVSEGVLVQWNNTLLRKVVSLVRGGYIRIGGFYSDYMHYAVPGSNYTRCPLAEPLPCAGPATAIPNRDGMCPCYFLLTMERWRETLDFAHATGMNVAFNLNAINGRSHLPSVAKKGNGTCGAATAPVPPWDSTEAEALMVWTRDNIAEDKWPTYWGLGNELTGLISPQQYAADIEGLQRLLSRVFVGHNRQPSVYAPCGCTGTEWNSELLAAIKANDTPLGAWSRHDYGHSEMTVASMADALYGGSLAAIEVSGATYAAIQSAMTPDVRPKDSEGRPTASWITESAWSATPPPFHCQPGAGNCTGVAAGIDPMLRSADMSWYVDALGSASLLGVDVFCRETLTGDWLETIGSWQQADGLAMYTPHPSFWVAALWRKLMGSDVLEVTMSALPSPSPPTTMWNFIPWVRVPNVSCIFAAVGPAPGPGSTLVPLLLPPHCPTEAECQRRCEMSRDSHGQPNCTIYDFGSYRGFHNSSEGFEHNRCWGRHDAVWELHSVDGLGRRFNDSFCERRVEPGSAPAGAAGLPPTSALRAYVHRAKARLGASSAKTIAVTYALANLWRNRSLTVQLQSADSAVQYVLSSKAPGDDMASLNGKRLSVSQPGDVLPSLDGEPVSGGMVTLPPRAVAFVTASINIAAPFQSLTIVTTGPGSKQLVTTARIISRVIRSKSNCQVSLAPGPPTAGELSLLLKIDQSLGSEAYSAKYDGIGEATVTGGDQMGVLFGAGAFLRASQFQSTGFVPPHNAHGGWWEATDAPKSPGSFRAIYMASHFGNWFINAPLPEVYQYLESVALWGANTLMITGADAGRRSNLSLAMPILKRNVKIGIHAKSIGMKVGSMFTNEGWTTQPPGIAYTSPASRGDKGDFGAFEHLVCPAKGLGYLRDEVYGPIFGNISSLGLSLDYIIAWPYDWGGCGCEHDWPWGFVGFPKMSVELIKKIRSVGHERAECIISTWHFQLSSVDEYGGLDRWLRANKHKHNFTHAMAAVPGGFAWLEQHGRLGGLPTLDFPEISMFGRCPWGGSGANPALASTQSDWDAHGSVITGGMPYTEGIYMVS
eukprot:SAG22_NODE_284_length_13033_cov_21.541828_5_plen_1109_part_00